MRDWEEVAIVAIFTVGAFVLAVAVGLQLGRIDRLEERVG